MYENMFTPTSSGPNNSACVRTTLVRLRTARMLLTMVLLSTIVSPTTNEFCELSRPPSVAARMLPSAFSNAGSQKVVDSMYRPNNEWFWETCQSILRSEEHTSELQSQSNLVCRLLL